jgi:Rieske Fe-S protein
VQLVVEGKISLTASRLVPHKTYVFLYPFENTPCFLLDVGEPVPAAQVPLGRTGVSYAWAGGVGKKRSIVAYSAICSHAYTHPTRENAMIHYFGPEQPSIVAQRGSVITCCVHGSAFDPRLGAVPLQPPAEIPLAAVVLEWDEDADALYAIGLVGQPVFEEFFKSFPKNTRREAEKVTSVWELERYSREVIFC